LGNLFSEKIISEEPRKRGLPFAESSLSPLSPYLLFPFSRNLRENAKDCTYSNTRKSEFLFAP
jgi:hypothetical protein